MVCCFVVCFSSLKGLKSISQKHNSEYNKRKIPIEREKKNQFNILCRNYSDESIEEEEGYCVSHSTTDNEDTHL